LLNRSAINGLIDPNVILIGKSPDRSKNMSVYSHGPSNNNLLGPQKSPYLGNNITGSGHIKKLDTNGSQSRSSNTEN
jgi:hypothetical protein